MFWPSFCTALVAVENIPMTVVNVILALSGSTIATYFVTVKLRGKISAADIANAALAGGVAIGSTCDRVPPAYAFVIGILAGLLSTIGFAAIQERLQKFIKKIDTCGVLNLHGLPGLFGGLPLTVSAGQIRSRAFLSLWYFRSSPLLEQERYFTLMRRSFFSTDTAWRISRHRLISWCLFSYIPAAPTTAENRSVFCGFTILDQKDVLTYCASYCFPGTCL